MAAQWPLVVTRLGVLLPTLPGWTAVKVYDGAAYDTQAATWATVAHATDGVTTTAGHYTTTLNLDGIRYVETGSVACQLTYTDDRATVAALRAKVFGLFDALDAAIRADRTLGVLSAEGTTDLIVDISSTQPIAGAGMTAAFSIDYLTIT